MKRLVLALLALLVFAVGASAQAVTNPGHIEYTPSADHAMLTKYVVGYFLSGATDPVQEADLAIVAPVGGVVTQVINSTPLPFGTYTAKLKSVAGAAVGEWSLPSNEFVRAPVAPPTALTVKK
jgi:hypothetical protein